MLFIVGVILVHSTYSQQYFIYASRSINYNNNKLSIRWKEDDDCDPVYMYDGRRLQSEEFEFMGTYNLSGYINAYHFNMGEVPSSVFYQIVIDLSKITANKIYTFTAGNSYSELCKNTCNLVTGDLKFLALSGPQGINVYEKTIKWKPFPNPVAEYNIVNIGIDNDTLYVEPVNAPNFTESYSFEVQYSYDNKNWHSCGISNYYAPLPIPSYDSLIHCTSDGKGKILHLRSRIYLSDGKTCSPWTSKEFPVYYTPSIDYSPKIACYKKSTQLAFMATGDLSKYKQVNIFLLEKRVVNNDTVWLEPDDPSVSFSAPYNFNTIPDEYFNGNSTYYFNYRFVFPDNTYVTRNFVKVKIGEYDSLSAGSIGSTQTICYNTKPSAFTNSTSATGGDGSFTYQWMKSTNRGTIWTNITGATLATYAEKNNLITTTMYKRVANNLCGSAESNVVTINVLENLMPGSIGSAQTICSGSTPEKLTQTAAPSGGTGKYTYQWQSSTDSVKWSDISGEDSATYDPQALTTSTYYRRAVTSEPCGTVYSSPVLIAVWANLTPGSIGSAQTICYSSTPAGLTQTAAPSGGTGKYTYQWQSSPNGSTWSDISGATSATYSPSALSASTYYRRAVTSDPCGTVYSSPVLIAVWANLTPGSIGSAQTICSGSTPEKLTQTAAPSGGTGTYTYQWQSSTDNASWSNISGETSAAYSPPALTDSMYYRRAVTSGSCGTVYSTPMKITVNPISVGGSVSSNQTICAGSTPADLTLSGHTGNVVKWQKSTSSTFSSTTDIVETSTTLSSAKIGVLTSTTYFRAVVQSGVCSSANSNYAKITVNLTSVGGSVSADQIICYGSTPAALILSGHTGNVVKWQKSTSSTFSSPTDIAETSTTLSSAKIGALTTTTYFRAVVQSGVCSSVNSNYATITVNPTSVGGSVSADQIICYGSTPAALTLSGHTGNVVKWQKSTSSTFSSPTDIVETTTTLPSAKIGALTTTTYFRAVVQSGACSSVKSNYATITVNPTSVGGSVSADQIICSGSTPASLTLSGHTGNVVKWQKSTSSTFSSPTDIDVKTATLPSEKIGALIETTYFRSVVQSGVCSSANSNYATITVNPLPNTAIGSDVARCDTGEITLSATPGLNGNTIRWYNAEINGNLEYTGNDLVISLDSTKSYYAESYNTATGCAAEQRKEIRGIVVTQAQINQNPQNSIICNNSITSFSVIASNAKSYQWEVRKAGTAVWVPILEAGSNPTYAGWDTNTLTLSDVPSSQNGNTYRCIVGSTPCEVKISEEALLQVSNIEVIPTVSNVSCKGSLTGTINTQIKNGIGNYSVTLKKNGETISTKNNISDTAKFTGLGAGIYSLEVTDGALCGKVVDNIQVLEPADSLAASISAFSYPKCFGSTDGSIAIQARGGWEHFTYEINGEDHGTNWLFDSLGAGDYSIKVTDQNGCSKTLEQTLTEPTKLAISKKSSVDPKCYGQNSGQIQLGATGGTKSYEFRVGELTQADSSFTGITAGDYWCLVIDANSCKDSIEVTLSQPDPVGYSIDRSDYHGYDIACFGGTDSITITPSGGKPPYAIDFDGSISSLSGEGKTFNNLNATHSYNFTIEDSQGCTVSNTVNLSQPDELRVSSFETTNATCFGLANGTVVVDSIGGVAPYEFVLKNSKGVIVKQETGNSFACDSLPASDYILDIMDTNNCSISTAFSIVEPPILKATIAVTDVTCFGGSDGSAVAAVAGGTFPYIYQWLNESGNEVGTSATLSNVKASDYRVKITDSNGCSGVSGQTGYIEQVASIHNPPSKLAFTTDVTPVACNGGSTGVIKVKPTGGWGSYEFGTTKNSFTTNNSITGLASGWYKIYVRDSLSCIDSADVMVGEQTSLVIDNISFTDVTCNGGNDGTVQVTVSGGVPNYRYYLDENEFSGSKDDLVAGDYTITVKDANGCSTFGKLTINQPEAISYTSEVKNSTCGLYDGYIKVNPSGGTGTLTVLWESSGTVGNSLTGIKSGNYPFTITDGVGCRSRSFSQSVSDEGGPDINLNNITNPLCYNGSDGAVSVEITSGTLPVKYKIYFEGIAKDSAIVDSLPFSKTYNDLKQGEYNVTAVDFNGCCTDKSFTITSPTDLLVSTSKTDVKCKGELSGSAEAIVTGGTAPYTIQWFDSSGSVVGVGSKLPNVKAGTYTVKVIDTNGCPSGGKTSTVEILEPQVELMLSIASKADVKCFGQNNGYVTLSASGGWGNYLYSSNDTAWQTSSTFDQLVAGDLNVYVKDRNGCKLSSTITINQNPPVEIDVSTTDITCFNANNGKIDIAATGGNGSYLYSINNGTTWNGSASFSNLQAGAYPIAAKDGNGCTVSGNVNISEPDKLELQISGFTPLKCFGDANAAVELQATGGVSNYQFSKNSESFVSESSFIGLSAGSYTFNVKDGNGCIATISKNIENPKKLSLSVSDYSDVSCYGGSNGSITLSATGGTPEYAFSINDSSAQPNATFGNLMAGDYHLKVVDANGCEASVPKAISQPASPLTLSVANYSDVSCYGKNDGKVVLLASGGTYPYSYSMGDGTFVSTSTFTALAASSGYSFTAKDSKGCTATVSKAISEPDELLIASANVKDPTCFGYTDGKVDVTVSGGTKPYTYLWSNGSSLATTGLVKAGNYSLQVTDKNGCKYSQAFTLLNPEKISPTLPEAAIICSNQTLTLDAGYSGLSHKWTSDNGFASSDQVVTLSKAGNYYLTVTDSKGCFGVDAVHLITRDIEIEADFLLPDKASLADTIVAIDISWPLPDSIKWVYHPDTFWQLNNTDWSVYLLPQQVGNHTVGIITYLMGCCATLDKTIAIGPYSENTKEMTSELSIIKDVQSYPNPSNGHFYVLVDLNSEAEVTLEIYAIYGKKITHETAKGQSHYKFDVNIRPIPGIYLLRISSGNEFKTFRMIVQ